LKSKWKTRNGKAHAQLKKEGLRCRETNSHLREREKDERGIVLLFHKTEWRGGEGLRNTNSAVGDWLLREKTRDAGEEEIQLGVTRVPTSSACKWDELANEEPEITHNAQRIKERKGVRRGGPQTMSQPWRVRY